MKPSSVVLKVTDVPCPDIACNADIGRTCRGLRGKKSPPHAARLRFRDGAQWAIDNLGAQILKDGAPCSSDR